MSNLNSVGNLNLQVIMDIVGVIDIFVPRHIVKEIFEESETFNEFSALVEKFIDDDYNLPDLYYFTNSSEKKIQKLYNDINNLGD